MKQEVKGEKTINSVNKQLSSLIGKELRSSKPRRRLLKSAKRSTTQEKEVEFFDAHKPLLKEGEYTLTAWQEITKKEDASFKETTPKISQDFLVSGPRYRIDEDVVNAVFPPKNSNGNHGYALPHIAFNRISVPWEMPMKDKGTWFCLVVFDEEKAPEIEEKKLRELNLTVPKSFDVEKKVSTIEVPINRIPIDKDLLCHSRIKGKTELAFVVGHRFPQNNGKSTVHLISLKDPLDISKTKKKRRYISLYHWSFECKQDKFDFKGLIKQCSVKEFYLNSNPTNIYYKEGYVPLPNFLRDGKQTLSLYRGPLLPYRGSLPLNTSKPTVTLGQEKPTSVNDRVIFRKEIAMADVSYAAAFQVGQLLTIGNKKVANTLFSWKRGIYREEKQRELLSKSEREFFIPQEKIHTPPEINTWIHSLLTLENVPFNYLVPYEEMLPMNSIRFFELDKVWLKHCLEGALSIGKEYFSFNSIDRWIKEDYTGVVIRNEVIADYPEMRIKAFTDSKCEREANVYFKRKLAKDILFCCFEKEITAVDLFLPVEAIHFGVKKDTNSVYKELRGERKKEKGKKIYLDDEVFFKESRSLKLDQLRLKMGVESSAEFAFQMVEGSPRVRINLKELLNKRTQ